MQLVFELIVQAIFSGVAALLYKVFGIQPSESGIREMWIGGIVVVAVIAAAIAVLR